MNLILAKRALGLFSIGLGLLAVAAPARTSRWLGLQGDPEAISAFGAREIASGSGLLSPVKPGPWFWLRVGGDVMDLAALRTALSRSNPYRHRVVAVAAVVAAIAVVDIVVALRASLHKDENAEAAT